MSKELVKSTLIALTSELKEKQNLTVVSMESVIQRHLQQAFDSVEDAENKRKLFRAFSLQVHTDWIQSKQPELFRLLSPNHAVLQQSLNKFNEQNVSEQFMQAANTVSVKPIDGLNKIFILINNSIFSLHNHHRYFKPVNFMAYGLSKITDYIFILGLIAEIPLLIIWGGIKLADFIQEGLLNILTNGHWNNVKNEYKIDHFDEAESRWLQHEREITYLGFEQMLAKERSKPNPDPEVINAYSKAIEDLLQLDDEAYKAAYIENLGENGEDVYDVLVNLFTPVNNFNKLTLIMQAFYQSITKPLPERTGAIILSLMLRTLRIVLFLPFLLINTGIELAKDITLGLMIAVPVVTGILRTIVPLILNIPLFMLDGARFIAASCTTDANTNDSAVRNDEINSRRAIHHNPDETEKSDSLLVSASNAF